MMLRRSAWLAVALARLGVEMRVVAGETRLLRALLEQECIPSFQRAPRRISR